jgi:uncharacterized protein YjaZ
LDVDVSNVKVPELTINRLEQDVFNIDTDDINGATKKLEVKYGTFYKAYYTGILNNGGIHDTDYAAKLKRFISDKDMRNAYKDCQSVYPDVNYLKDEFTKTFKYYKHYFPNKNIPKVVTMMSGFNYPVAPLDSTLGIGLEMYLGSNSIYYKMLAFPKYKSMFMNKENIMPDVIRQWTLNTFPYNMNKSDFLSQMIYMGKILYLTDALIPDFADTLKIQYSKKQMQYCTQNEFNIWSYFISQKKLYTTDQAEIMKFTADGPFTSALSKDAPPRIAYWVGLRIVKQYMDKNPDITMQQLMDETDAQKILTKAKYKPGK